MSSPESRAADERAPNATENAARAARITIDEQAELASVAAEFLANRAGVEFPLDPSVASSAAGDGHTAERAVPAPDPDAETTRALDQTVVARVAERAPVAPPRAPRPTPSPPAGPPAGTDTVAAPEDRALDQTPLASLWDAPPPAAASPAVSDEQFDTLLNTLALEPLNTPNDDPLSSPAVAKSSASPAPRDDQPVPPSAAVPSAPPPVPRPPPPRAKPAPGSTSASPAVPRAVWLGFALLGTLTLLLFALLWWQVTALRQAPSAPPSAPATDATATIATAIAMAEQRILGLESRLGEMTEALTALERTAEELTARDAPPPALPAVSTPPAAAERPVAPPPTERPAASPPAAVERPAVAPSTERPAAPPPAETHAPAEHHEVVLSTPRYTIQLAAFERESGARAFVRARRLEDREIYLARSGPQGRMYAVVFGLFDSNEAALAALARLPEPQRSEGWSRRLTAGTRLLPYRADTGA